MQRSANAEAVNHFGSALRALQILPESGPRDQQELKLQTANGTPPHVDQRVRRAGRGAIAFARALELCGQAPDGPVLFPVIRGLWYYYFVRSDFTISRQLAEQMQSLGRDLQDMDSEMVGHRLLGATCFVTGQLESSLAQFERVMTFYKSGDDARLAPLHGLHPRMGALSWLLWAKWYVGFPDQSTASERQFLGLIEEVDHPHSSAFALGYTGGLSPVPR